MLKSRSVSRDKFILISYWVVTIVLLFLLVPKSKLRNGILAFLFQQIITWVLGVLAVENRLIKYPIREFKNAYKGSFSFEYFLFPALCTIFNLYYPERKNKFWKFLYLTSHTAFIVLNEVLLEKYTNLIEYIKWKWYWSFISVGTTFYVSRLFYRWFFKEEFRACEEVYLE